MSWWPLEREKDFCGTLFNHSLQFPSVHYLSSFVLQTKVLKAVLPKFTDSSEPIGLYVANTPLGGLSDIAYQCKTAAWYNGWGSVPGNYPAGRHPSHVHYSVYTAGRFASNQHLVSSRWGVRDQEGTGTVEEVQQYITGCLGMWWARSHVVLRSLRSYWNEEILEDVGALED